MRTALRCRIFEQEAGRRAAVNLMTKDETRRIAAGIARLPELLRADQPDAMRWCKGDEARRIALQEPRVFTNQTIQ
jgi:hypothetical protein